MYGSNQSDNGSLIIGATTLARMGWARPDIHSRSFREYAARGCLAGLIPGQTATTPFIVWDSGAAKDVFGFLPGNQGVNYPNAMYEQWLTRRGVAVNLLWNDRP